MQENHKKRNQMINMQTISSKVLQQPILGQQLLKIRLIKWLKVKREKESELVLNGKLLLVYSITL